MSRDVVRIRHSDESFICMHCGFIRSNRIAGDDNEVLLLGIAARPLSKLPFPLEGLLKETL